MQLDFIIHCTGCIVRISRKNFQNQGKFESDILMFQLEKTVKFFVEFSRNFREITIYLIQHIENRYNMKKWDHHV